MATLATTGQKKLLIAAFVFQIRHTTNAVVEAFENIGLPIRRGNHGHRLLVIASLLFAKTILNRILTDCLRQ